MSQESITFRCSLPPLQSAIQITGDGTGLRIKLDIPESEMVEALGLLAWRERVLVVRIQPEDGDNRQ